MKEHDYTCITNYQNGPQLIVTSNCLFLIFSLKKDVALIFYINECKRVHTTVVLLMCTIKQ